jgi:hypothetical protein
MRSARMIRPVNSLVLVCDQLGGLTPSWRKDQQILWTDTCISIACYPEQDGPTEVILGTSEDVDAGHAPKFDGLLKIPSGILSVQNVIHEPLLTMDVSSPIVRVQVWLNHPRWANKVIIGVS